MVPGCIASLLKLYNIAEVDKTTLLLLELFQHMRKINVLFTLVLKYYNNQLQGIVRCPPTPVHTVIRRRGGLMVSALNTGSGGPGSSPGRGTALCSWARHLTPLTPIVPLPIRCGLASYPGGGGGGGGGRNTTNRFMVWKLG